jgi:hypothetical protein
MAQRQQPSVDLSLNPRNYSESDLRALGFEFSADQLGEKNFRLGGWSVVTRVSVVRITTMKLCGIGLAAALCAVSQHTGRYTAQSAAMCAAINMVAAYHYRQIWNIRKQTYGGSKYEIYTAIPGGEGEQLVGGRETREKAAVFMQEELSDWTRASDWIVTLVLLSLDIGHQRQYMYYASAGKIPLPPISKEWAAFFQAAMMGFYMIYRFWCNEARSFLNPTTKTYSPARASTQILAFGSFGVACLFFVFALMGAIGGLPSTDAVSEPSLKSDILCLQLLTLNWIGYPLMAIAARIGHIGVPGDEYSATWSLVKDTSFAFLDIVSKGGLAAVVVLKAFWMTAAEESALVEAGKLALAGANATVG